MYNRLLFLVGLKTASFSELKRESDSRDQMNQDWLFFFNLREYAIYGEYFCL